MICYLAISNFCRYLSEVITKSLLVSEVAVAETIVLIASSEAKFLRRPESAVLLLLYHAFIQLFGYCIFVVVGV